MKTNRLPDPEPARVSLVQASFGDCVKVEFSRHTGHYKNLAYAMQDIVLFNCRPVYDDWQLEAEATVRQMQFGPEWYKSGEYFRAVGV